MDSVSEKDGKMLLKTCVFLISIDLKLPAIKPIFQETIFIFIIIIIERKSKSLNVQRTRETTPPQSDLSIKFRRK